MFKLLKNKSAIFIRKTFSNKFIWKLFRPIAVIFADLYQSEIKVKAQNHQEAFKQKYLYLLTNGVRRGPFKGLKYPFLSAIYSAFFPKILGYYEMELHPVLELLKRNNYDTIHDVGCAEGYYAVGLAKMFPTSKLLAYDLDPQARQKTNEMALANEVSIGDGFQIKNNCTTQELLRLNPKAKHLIFSDCEGFEDELFTPEVISHLFRSDFIIEVHDFVKPGLCDLLAPRFSSTHKVEIIQSIHDLYRYRVVEDQEVLKLNLRDQIELLAEKRPAQMEWLFCTSLPLESENLDLD
ncbi:MAG TPA: class I SAM-dependent methyltransferase [Algoriphagus sp.]|nr:class I SAM-dependent methyltransferase [Algoriphagus sp.]